MNDVQRYIFWKKFKEEYCTKCVYPYGCGLKNFSALDMKNNRPYYSDLLKEIEGNENCRLFKN
jgi:hypothetical protein